MKTVILKVKGNIFIEILANSFGGSCFHKCALVLMSSKG